MQVSIESGEGLERRMTVELPADDVQQEVDKRLQGMTRTVRIDGFRPGKVPLRIVRQRFGDSVRQDVIGEMIQKTFYEAATQEKVTPAGMPRIDDLDAENASYTAVFEVVPTVELGDMSGVTVKRPNIEIADADVDAMVDKLRKQRASWAVIERAAEMGDQLLISFKGMIDGEVFDGGSAENVPIELGSNSLIEGFEEGLVGAVAGDSRNLELKFPEDYRVQDLAGKDTVFEVDIAKVRHEVLPEIDEEFVKAFGIDSGKNDDFMADIRKNMDHELDQKIKSTVKERVMDALLEVNSFDVPQVMVNQEAESMKKQSQENMAQQGHGSSIDLPIELFKDQAQRRVTLGMLMNEIVSSNDIVVDQDRVTSTIEEFAQSYEKPEEVIEHYKSNSQSRASVENLVLEDQVVDWVLEQVKVEDEAAEFDAFMNPQAEAEA